MDTELARALKDARTTLVRLMDGSAKAVDPTELSSLLGVIERVESALHRTSQPAPFDLAKTAPLAAADDLGAAERQELERRVEELTRALGLADEFLSTLGHELRNPLAPIFMQAQYLLDAVRQMRSEPAFADIPVVIMTALPGAVSADEIAGHQAVLQKPFTPERLFEVVRSSLRSGADATP